MVDDQKADDAEEPSGYETPIVPTSCDHANPKTVHDESTVVRWCSRCGAFRDEPGAWQLPYLARMVFRKLPPPPDPDGIPF